MSNNTGYIKAFIDTETTGTDRKLHEIFQIAGKLISPSGKILEEFDYKFRPLSLEHADPEALKWSGMTVEDLAALPMSAGEAYQEFTAMLARHINKFDKKDKAQFIAYNAGFDTDFIREFFAKHNDNYYGSWFFQPAIDVMAMMAIMLINVRASIPSFKLGVLCECAGLGWDENKAHDAQYDIDKTIELYNFAISHMPSL